MRKTRLISLSGGFDSTFLLAKCLRETDDVVVAHHVHLKNSENRAEAENVACNRIVNFCRSRYRDFLYTTSTVDRRDLDFYGYDVLTVAAECGVAAVSYSVTGGKMPDVWMLGLCAEDIKNIPAATTQATGERIDHIKAAIAAACYPLAAPIYERPRIHSKREIIDYLGPDLASLCWTCRTPIDPDARPRPCGQCRACKDLRAAQ